ncbi:VQ motif-containing protein 4-like [Diospyros lotus]|uniref:VQ motif-containing protein 4-like n=1 Tax=Diospyros lotus TaxID=55363 RepID=UPI0022549973|nr:VQ motif-containing protein 4-like [Diospyros lotus]
MEISPKRQENHNPSLQPSPNSHSTTSSGGSATTAATSPTGQRHPSTPPRPVTRSEPNNPFPTTFVQADTSSFKQVVQMLTGSSETARHAPERNPIPPVKTGPMKQPASKLYERRNSHKNFKISPLVPGFSPRKPEILSPSVLDFPSLALSPITPLVPDPFNRSPASSGSLYVDAEEQAIAKKGFYLHPSPANTPRDSEPRLLPLFPVTSPRVSGSSS